MYLCSLHKFLSVMAWLFNGLNSVRWTIEILLHHQNTSAMKNFRKPALLIVSLLFFSLKVFCSNSTTPPNNSSLINPVVKPSPFHNMTVKAFLLLTPKKYYELTGKKLSLPQKLSLKIAQYKVKRMLKKNKQVDVMLMAKDVDTKGFDVLGFILGLALGPIGVLIGYLVGGKGSAVFKWSIYGAVIWLLVVLLFFIAL